MLEISAAQKRHPDLGTALRVAVVREMPHLLLQSGNPGGQQITGQIGRRGGLQQVICRIRAMPVSGSRAGRRSASGCFWRLSVTSRREM